MCVNVWICPSSPGYALNGSGSLVWRWSAVKIHWNISGPNLLLMQLFVFFKRSEGCTVIMSDPKDFQDFCLSMMFKFQPFLKVYFSGNVGSFKIPDCSRKPVQPEIQKFGTYPRVENLRDKLGPYPRGFQGRSRGCSGDTRCATCSWRHPNWLFNVVYVQNPFDLTWFESFPDWWNIL